MTVRLLTAVPGGQWEAGLVSAYDRRPLGLTVVRRAVDVAETLSVVDAGLADAVLLAATMPMVDAVILARLRATGTAVVAAIEVGDQAAALLVRRLGITAVVEVGANAADVAAVVLAAVASVGAAQRAGADGAALDAGGDAGEVLAVAPRTHGVGGLPVARGSVVAVWGPTGAPGRTSVAVALADELARRGTSALLVDGDTYGAAVAQTLGVLDDGAGLLEACRLAARGRLDRVALAATALTLPGGLRLLTGSARPDRWPEAAAPLVQSVLEAARGLAAVTVVDCGFCLEEDEALQFDTVAPARNAATLATLRDADVVVALGAADPVGVQRLIRGLDELRRVRPDVAPVVVVNRVRGDRRLGHPAAEVGGLLERFGGVGHVAALPYDATVLEAAVGGRTVAEVRADAPFLVAVRALAAAVAPAAPLAAPADRPRGDGRGGWRGRRGRTIPA